MEILNNIFSGFGFDWKLALASSINFLVLFFLFKKFFFARIQQTLDERQKTIQDGVDKSIKAEELLADAQVTRDTVISDAKNEGITIINQFKEKAEILFSERKSSIETEVALLKQNLLLDAHNTQASVFDATVDTATKEVFSHLKSYFKENMTEAMHKDYTERRINTI